MNYLSIYNKIIELRKLNPCSDEYIELHHIIPKSLGGKNINNNIVKLSAREHFICHLLLTKIYPEGTINLIKMIKAFMCMMLRHNNSNQKRYVNSHFYAYLKENFSKAQSINQTAKGNSQFGKIWIHNKTLKLSKSVKKELLEVYLKEGWEKGRILNWGTRNNHKKLKTTQKSNVRKQNQEKNILLYTQWYDLYCEVGWEAFVKHTGYNKTKQNLVEQFKRYVKDYNPQNGKKRGKQFQKSKIKCKYCNKEFYPKSKTQKYCSVECRIHAKNNRIWISNVEGCLKHVLSEELLIWLNKGWFQVKAVGCKEGWVWIRV